jgi:hypothetical protein
MIREFPNGVTHIDEVDIPTTEYIGRMGGTWGSETSQYPEEKKTTYSRLLVLDDSQESFRDKMSARFR